jgi:cation diffusion facilitator family transporter
VADGSRRTVILALVRAGLAVAKLAAAVVTGSAAMFAAGLHSVADAGNGLLPGAAQRRGGRAAFVWALLAALGLFVVGGAVAIYHGIHELVHPSDVGSFAVAYAVLAVAFVVEAASFVQATRRLRDEARRFERDLLRHVVLSADPGGRANFAEDAAAPVGTAVAVLGVGLHQATGSVAPDAVASILIGLVMASVALFLTERNRDFLAGEDVSAAAKERIAGYIAAYPGIVEVRDLDVTFTGPDEVWVVARVEVADSLSARGVEALVVDVERTLIQRSAAITRADIVPVGSAPVRQREPQRPSG